MNLYQQTVLEARKKFLKLTLEQEKEILKIYEEAGSQIVKKLSKAKAGGVTARYLTELEKSINQYKRELSTKLSKSIKDGMESSSQIASAVQLSYFDSIAPNEDLKSTFRKMFSQLNANAVNTLIGGNYYRDGKTLDNRIWNLSKKNANDIDRLIKINIANGTNARELAKQLDAYVNPSSRTYPKTLDAGISKKISYQAQRLARTSLDHANTEAYIQGSKMNPFCTGLKWNLSSSHYIRQVRRRGPDICDRYAKEDAYNLGVGVFLADKYPISHPNCLCYCTTVTIDIEKARAELIAWLKGEDNPKLDKWLDDYGEEFGIDINSSKTFRELAASKEVNSGIIKKGAFSGALNPESKEAENHAKQYYESVRHMKTDAIHISKNTGWKKEAIDKIKEHVFIKEHDLGNDKEERFFPSYDMAQSWQRLIEGKNIKEQDIVLLKHEYLELSLMKNGLSQNEAHIESTKQHNFAKYCD